MRSQRMATMTMGQQLIAGWKTADDWQLLAATLIPGGSREKWVVAYDEFFLKRVEKRYLDPIRLLQQHGTFEGEGFSIVTIQCALVEFLESTYRGVNYRFTRDIRDLGQFEYCFSGKIFADFFVTHGPFKTFMSKVDADEFYKNVRCGLMHEARTKNGWSIRAKSPGGIAIDCANRAVYRDDFQLALESWIGEYRQKLLVEKDLQEALVRKMNDLCV